VRAALHVTTTRHGTSDVDDEQSEKKCDSGRKSAKKAPLLGQRAKCVKHENLYVG
jgi:hypothetical protein